MHLHFHFRYTVHIKLVFNGQRHHVHINILVGKDEEDQGKDGRIARFRKKNVKEDLQKRYFTVKTADINREGGYGIDSFCVTAFEIQSKKET